MKYWKDAEELAAKSFSLSMATTNEDGSPQVTPIGSLFLTGVGKGLYFEKLPQRMRSNLDRDPRFSILAVRGGRFYWMKALFLGRFNSFPALRLNGTAGARRVCTEEERQIFDSRFGMFRRTKGYDILWKDMRTVRDLTFEAVIPVNVAAMTKGLEV